MQKYYVKDINVMYYDGKLLPVFVGELGKETSVKFILSNVSMQMENIVFKKLPNGQDNGFYAVLNIVNGEKRQVEIATLYSVVKEYGKNLYKKFPDLSLVTSVSRVPLTNSSQIMSKFLNTQLDVNEIVQLFNELQKEYNKKKCMTFVNAR